MRSVPQLLIAAISLACAADSTAPPNLVTQPKFSAQDQPAELPNVFRYETGTIFAVIDTKTDLWAYAGLPDDPRSLGRCGGTGTFSSAYIQDAGQLQEVIHEIAKADNVNIHVYRLSTFTGFCTSTPIASGKGNASYHDNDYFVTGNGIEAYGNVIDGFVTLTDGRRAKVQAQNLWHVYPDGSAQVIVRKVLMNVF